jgi:hypothetical protein
MKPAITQAAFEVLLSQTGLPLSPEQKQSLYEPYALVEAMLEHLGKPLPRESEPSLIFIPEVR